ncbi:unnamed protein product [Haemonchus placei]|uniref:Uncharacterized protein n=1 Tax=Haemonchus placei TaxID=6290 RepID=A0A0N4WYH2_HAEPC|nr:unnamed protein product [Haemonchus placei]
MATWHRLERHQTEGVQSVIPCRKSVRFRYFDFDEAASVLESALMSGPPPPREHSPLPPGFWGNLGDMPLVRGSPSALPVIAKPQRPRMGTAEYQRRFSSESIRRRSLIDKEILQALQYTGKRFADCTTIIGIVMLVQLQVFVRKDPTRDFFPYAVD